MKQQEVKEPKLAPIKNGWAALGDGWAVHGHTPEEAIQKFHEAEQLHREIDARSLCNERQETQAVYESNHDKAEET